MATLYSGGLVFDGSGTLLERHGVLVEGELIERVAPAQEFEGFAGERVDTTGMTVLPGLIDCHVHLVFSGGPDPFHVMIRRTPGQIVLSALDNAQATLRGGVTAIRDCGGKDFLEFAVRDACNQGRLVGPTIRASGHMICMTGGHGRQMATVADGVDGVVKAVRYQIQAGCDVVKIIATGGLSTPGVNPEDAHYSAAEVAAAIAEGHRFHKPGACHAMGRDGILNSVRGGADSVEHGVFMDEQCVEEMLESGTYLVATLSVINNMLHGRDHGLPSEAVEKTERVVERGRQSVKMFYDAGGKLAMGTDAGTQLTDHGDNALELKFLVEAGVRPADALVAATGNAADLNRFTDRGRISDGQYADLLIVDGNPVDDIMMAAQRRNHRAVVKNGAVVAGSMTSNIPAG